MDRICRMHRRDKKFIDTAFYFKNLRGRDHLGGTDTDERIILKWTLERQEIS
jgi:hypothetical protein